MGTIKIGFIGAGKVGFSLGKYLKDNNTNLSGYYSKKWHSAKEAAIFTSSKPYDNLESLIKDSDTIFITTPDVEIEGVWNEIKEFNINNKLICHCSGSISSEIFSNITEYGAYGYSIHPILAISNKYSSYKDFSNTFITIEGDKKHQDYLKNLFTSLGNSVEIISKENKTLYHLSCVSVSNFVLGIINTGIEYLKKCDFSEEDTLKAIFPLIEFNIKNIKENGTINSLTGPVERGDLNTIKNHCEVLDKEDGSLYRLLSKNLLQIAKVKNQNRDYTKIEEYLGD